MADNSSTISASELMRAFERRMGLPETAFPGEPIIPAFIAVLTAMDDKIEELSREVRALRNRGDK